MYYDKKAYEAVRYFAVTDVNDIKVGETYYSNYWSDPIKVRRLLTMEEHYANVGISYEPNQQSRPGVSWIEAEDGGYYSLSDNGVTDKPYNPWLLFKDSAVRSVCDFLLVVEFHQNVFNSWYETNGKEN